MPFCTQCGNQVQPADTFCAACGARQGADAGNAAKPGPGTSSATGKRSGDALSTMEPRTAAMLCYIPLMGWIASIVVLAADRFRNDKDVRFHAFQGLYLFVLWLFVEWVFGPITRYSESTRFISKLLQAAVFGAWIFMIVKTKQGDNFRLPILGELADRSVSEQK